LYSHGMFRFVFIIFAYFGGALNAYGQDELVGFEWTFSNFDLVKHNRRPPQTDRQAPEGMMPQLNFTDLVTNLRDSPANKVRTDWLKEVQKQCSMCTVDKNKIYTPEGFWFELTIDNNVLEVKTEPMTEQQLTDRSFVLEQLVWKSAKKVGVTPHKRLGGGHLHLDLKSHFGHDRLLFRNFVVDLMNRPELFMGGLGLNYFNPPLAFYGPKAAKKFKKLVAKFDQNPHLSIEDFMKMMSAFYNSLEHPVLPTPYAKFQALNFEHILLGTLEIRALRPQVSAEHSLRLVKMFKSRIKTLKGQNAKIEIDVPDLSQSYKVVKKKGYRHYLHNLKPQKIMRSVQNYALAGGLSKHFYDDFVTEELKQDLKKIKTSGKNKKNKARSCKSFL